jgi:branched-chain amino acid aminotransferase
MTLVWKLEPQLEPLSLKDVEIPPGLATLDEVSSRLPSGAYTTFRTFEGKKVLRLADHLHRLECSAELVGQPWRLDASVLRWALRQVIDQYPPSQDLRIRLTLDLEAQLGTVYFTVDLLKVPPPEAYQLGVKVVTCDLRRPLPKAKLTGFIARAELARQRLPPDANEAIMVDVQGCLLEGLSSNFFAVLGEAVYTAEEGVLSGVTRSLVLESAAHLDMPVRLEPVKLEDLPRLQEAFITSSSRGILPVSQADQARIGAGRPGEITHRLMGDYVARLRNELEEI